MFKNINEIKTFPSASREWKDSMYSYNENTLINAPHNDKVANDIINMVLHLTLHNKTNTKSKRMRNLIRRNTTRKLIVSKPSIKQTSDKVIVTAYIFDREKAMHTRRLFFIKNSLCRSTINYMNKNIAKNTSVSDLNTTGLLTNDNSTSTSSKLISLPNTVKLRDKLIKRVRKNSPNKQTKRNVKLYLKRLSYKHKINYKILCHTMYKSFLNKKSVLNNLFMFKFLKWTLSYFNITVFYVKHGKVLPIINSNNRLSSIKLKNNQLILVNGSSANKDKLYNITSIIKTFRIPNLAPLIQIRLINKILLTNIKVMIAHYIDNNMKTGSSLHKLFDLYKNKYMIRHTMFYLRKQKLALGYLVKLYNNKLKYNNLLYGFKYLLGNTYSKRVKLNLVNLKYLHLDSDILLEAVSTKLRKKSNSVLKILNKVLTLVKVPNIVTHSPKIQNISKFKIFDWSSYSTLTNGSPINSMLDNLLRNMFPNNIKYDKHELAHNILYSIKHKWVRGVRLEAKGRLTKRYTASRSLFKLRYKGSLRNLDHLKKPNFTREQVSVVMLRNSMKPNVQYTFTASRKRIGVYGIKGWISGY